MRTLGFRWAWGVDNRKSRNLIAIYRFYFVLRCHSLKTSAFPLEWCQIQGTYLVSTLTQTGHIIIVCEHVSSTKSYTSEATLRCRVCICPAISVSLASVLVLTYNICIFAANCSRSTNTIALSLALVCTDFSSCCMYFWYWIINSPVCFRVLSK